MGTSTSNKASDPDPLSDVAPQPVTIAVTPGAKKTLLAVVASEIVLTVVGTKDAGVSRCNNAKSASLVFSLYPE